MSDRAKIILGVSLILNVFLVGLGIGVLVTGARIAPPKAERRPTPNIWMAAEALPPTERDRFRAMLRAKAAEVQPELKSVRVARRQATALISQPTYDADAVADALQTARQGEMNARGKIDTAFVEYLKQMGARDRAALAEALVRNRPAQMNAAVRREGGAAPAAN